MDWEAGAGSWHQEHRRATLDEIVAVPDTELTQVRRHSIEDLTHAKPTDPAAETERAVCPEYGDRMIRRGRRRQEVLVPWQAEPVRLERTYQTSLTCGCRRRGRLCDPYVDIPDGYERWLDGRWRLSTSSP